MSVLALAGDGELGVDGKHSTKFGACLGEPTEMGMGGDFEPHRQDQARLVVQGTVGPFDRLFETSRDEMDDPTEQRAATANRPEVQSRRRSTAISSGAAHIYPAAAKL